MKGVVVRGKMHAPQNFKCETYSEIEFKGVSLTLKKISNLKIRRQFYPQV